MSVMLFEGQFGAIYYDANEDEAVIVREPKSDELFTKLNAEELEHCRIAEFANGTKLAYNRDGEKVPFADGEWRNEV